MSYVCVYLEGGLNPYINNKLISNVNHYYIILLIW